MKVSQAVAGEIVLEKLLDTLMRTAMAQAGAERVLLILARGLTQRIAAQATTSGDTVTVHLRDEAVAETILPESVLHYVLRTGESVILDDAAARSPFAVDSYIRERQARSILCLPLLAQAKLIGALYLENSLAAGVFAPARVAVLKLLASQAAIALEKPVCIAISLNEKRRSGAWLRPTSSASSSGMQKARSLRPTTRFYALLNMTVRISSLVACVGQI
jgi:GAF domain-containing protein